LLALAGAILVGHSLVYNFVTDDAYISFVYSRNFAEHGELAFNLGQPVEGYTNFSWTLVLGILMWIGIPPEIASRVLGTACGLATLYVTFRMVERALGRKTLWSAVPPLLLACSSGFACWTSGGLETQLFTLLVVASLDALVAAVQRPRALRRAGVLLALASMTRPEGPLVAAAFGLARYIQLVVGPGPDEDDKRSRDSIALDRHQLRPRWLPGRNEVIAAAWFLVIWAPWFAWRWWYYGYPFPNTYYVKAAGDWTSPSFDAQMTRAGLYYLWVWINQTHLIVVLPFAGIGLAAADARTPRFALTFASAILALVYLPYVVSVGGDFMGLHRFIMPMFVIAAIAVALGFEAVISLVPREQHRSIVAGVFGALLVVSFAASQWRLTDDSTRSCAHRDCPNDHGIDSPAFLMTYTEDRAAIGRATASCFRDDDFAILGGAGAQPYYARMRGIDVFGLVSRRIAHEEPRSNARAGHTKFGTPHLLAQYDPTFVMSCYRLHDKPAPPPLPCDVGFWKARGYESVTVHVPGMQQYGEYYTFLAKRSRNFTCGP
jgi:hypothetical protein